MRAKVYPRSISPVYRSDALPPGYANVPKGKREQIEQEIRALRLRLWSSPEDKHEITAEIEALEAQLRALQR